MQSKYYTTLLILLFPFIVAAQALLNPHTQKQFENLLPIPSVIDARSGGTLSITISQFPQNLGLKSPATGKPLYTNVWGYNGTYPGPTILAQKDVSLHVFYHNKLVDKNNRPLPHLLRVDESIDWALKGIANWQQYGVPVVTHLHGGHTESASDGLPDAWFTTNFTKKGTEFKKGD